MKPTGFLLCCVMLVLSACGSHQDVTVLKLAHSLDTQHPVHHAIVHMAERLEHHSGGTMRVDIYPSGQLGTERELMELLQIGSLAMTKVSSSPMEGFVPSKYDEILNLKALGLKSALLLPVGYRAEDDMFSGFLKVRKNITDTVIEL